MWYDATNVFQMSPCAVRYESILLADQKYEDRGRPVAPSSPSNNLTRPTRNSNRLRARPAEYRQKLRSEDATDVSALCRHFLAAYNIRPDFFCKFQGRTSLLQCQQSGTVVVYIIYNDTSTRFSNEILLRVWGAWLLLSNFITSMSIFTYNIIELYRFIYTS